jgi:hypothetical protein
MPAIPRWRTAGTARPSWCTDSRPTRTAADERASVAYRDFRLMCATGSAALAGGCFQQGRIRCREAGRSATGRQDHAGH